MQDSIQRRKDTNKQTIEARNARAGRKRGRGGGVGGPRPEGPNEGGAGETGEVARRELTRDGPGAN